MGMEKCENLTANLHKQTMASKRYLRLWASSIWKEGSRVSTTTSKGKDSARLICRLYWHIGELLKIS